MVVDQFLELDGETIKDQMKDFKDIMIPLQVAPATKHQMLQKKLYSLMQSSGIVHTCVEEATSR